MKGGFALLAHFFAPIQPHQESVVALIMGKNGEKMDFGYGKTFLEKVSWGGPETPFCGISGPIPACGGVYTEKWTKF